MIIKNKKSLNLYSNCIVVNGYNRSVIMDLQKNDYHFIPLELGLILQKKKNIS